MILQPSDPPPGVQPVTPQEVAAAIERPEEDRTALPYVGEHVLFRREEWGPAVPATIVAIQDMETPEDEPDVHLWRHPIPEQFPPSTWTHPTIRAQLVLKPDPWPWVVLELESGGQARSRESRVRGSSGWLRADEAKWLMDRSD
jgi:hypothetical protein